MHLNGLRGHEKWQTSPIPAHLHVAFIMHFKFQVDSFGPLTNNWRGHVFYK